MSTPAKHTLTLTQGAASMLAQILAVPGHLTKPDDLYRAGAVIETNLADIAPMPKGTDESAWKAWAEVALPPIEITERQRATCQEAVRTACAKGSLGAGKNTSVLLGALGLGEG